MLSVSAIWTLTAGGWPFSLSLSAVVQASQPSLANFPTFIRNDTVFEHLALHPDPSVGWVYIGAQDLLFQLNQFLLPNLQEETGPVTDSQDCLPPVTESNCPQAKKTNNHNKLLLINLDSEELITCGSVNQGICQKRDLNLINKILFSTERPVDTQYVAANHPNVSTVGIVVHSHLDRQPVLFVGRGYTNSHPPISTRNLAEEPIFSYEETAKLAVAGRLSEYDHHFVAAFAHSHHVYFLFYRRDLKSQSREYRTYISRICLGDQAYYSYVEVPLTCRSRTGKIYNLLQAVQLGSSTDGTGSLSSDIFLGVFSTNVASSAAPSEDSALCMFNLKDVDHRINSTRDLCYTQMGREAGGSRGFSGFGFLCSGAAPGSLGLGAPSISYTSLGADLPSARLTAVAVSMKVGHTIAFLGDSKGNLHKVRCSFGSTLVCVKYGATVAQELSARPVIGRLQVRAPLSLSLSLCPWARHLTHVACWWWSEGPVAPVLGSLASVSAPQGSCGYIVAHPHQCVNVCVNG
uniref:Sema domain-containing protein n=1 Tax=Nothobranchius furzeri TaxID=105023 RepID=A0A8C6PAY0_NOTFU